MTPETPEEEIALNAVRVARNAALADTDRTQFLDNGLDEASQTSYAGYRQYLRDLPATITTEEVMAFSGEVQTYDAWAAA